MTGRTLLLRQTYEALRDVTAARRDHQFAALVGERILASLEGRIESAADLRADELCRLLQIEDDAHRRGLTPWQSMILQATLTGSFLYRRRG